MTESMPQGKGQGKQNLGADTDNVLRSEEVQIERKTITCTLKQNQQGQFLRISEQAGCHRNTVIIPAAGLRDFRRILDRMIEGQQSGDDTVSG